ncbi:rhodanese-like domain-containing protein 11, chloroplastic [Artemisia annua]|uniref:Rhodanese-like domain-containing protein 11, chloroplastic n=1 Tax=Artemisia annua TaxID=35608 RepID=A0A2U1PIC4_ARTAN|nr:rhodanese-like domain-containing protein 11, chloroplastic [Artemisia annua]
MAKEWIKRDESAKQMLQRVLKESPSPLAKTEILAQMAVNSILPKTRNGVQYGGLSEFLGWTDQQRAQAAKEGWGYRLVFSARLIGVVIAADALFIAVQQAARYLQDLRGN